MNLLENLKWRGMLNDFTPNLTKVLETRKTRGYIGFDPTASSLHIGNLATVMLLKHLQLAGHEPVALVGGATGMVGDPSGKKEERKLLDEETLRFNETQIKIQLSQFLDFKTKINPARLENNYNWFKKFGFLDFLRTVGKHISINYMMTKDSVANRLETGLSFTEFSYQLLQGYDFYHLYKFKNTELQMGGSDQWGNITTGIELIRRILGREAYGFTCPLITRADGQKFGKSEGRNIWLDSKRTSPYKFYQFWLNSSDKESPKFLRVFTLLNYEEIQDLENQHISAPHQRILQKHLAKEVTIMVHGEQTYNKAVELSKILFQKSTIDKLQSLDNRTLLEILEGIPKINILRSTLQHIENIPDLLSSSTKNIIFSSKSEATRMIKGGGISFNKEKITIDTTVKELILLQNRYLLVQKGKKNYFLIIVGE